MKISVIGAGAIGGLVGGYLKKAGYDIFLTAHENQVQAVLKKGLRITAQQGTESIPVNIGTRLQAKCDLAIFATKTQDLEAAYEENKKFLTDAVVLTTQNGVQADNLLKKRVPAAKHMSSIVMFGSTYTNPGEIMFNFPGDWIIGKPYGENDAKTKEYVGLLSQAFPVVLSDNIMGMKWLKLFVNFNNCIPAVIGKSMQETFADMDFCRLSIHLLREGVGIVEKAGIELVSMPHFPADRIYGLVNMPLEQAAAIMNKSLTSLSKEPLFGSILQSIMRKKKSEIDYINGEVVHLAQSLGVEAPLNKRIVDMVHEVEKTSKFLEPANVKEEFQLNST